MKMKVQQHFSLLLTCCLLLCSGQLLPAQPLAVADLKCEYLENPLGIDATAPRLGWKMQTVREGARQVAFQVQAASTPEKLAAGEADLWDTGKQNSIQSAHMRYAGKPLASRQQCFWRVKVWDEAGNESPWSPAAYWEMALLDAAEWQASWIRHPDFTDGQNESKPAPFFRKNFTVNGLPGKARAYVTGLGYFELYINGKKVGDHLLDPVKTRYDKAVRYLVHDITDLLKPGENTVGMVLGTGWYNHFANAVWGFNKAPWRAYPEALCQLEITGADGNRQVISSDATWKTAQGPIRFDGIRNGETFDARLEMPGWSEGWFNDSDWQQAVVSQGPAGALRPQMIQPIKATKEVKPVSVTEIEPGVWVFDLGQNIAGFSRLKVSGPRGTEISMKMGEKLYPDGRVEQKQILRFLRSGDAQTDRYILKGEGEEVWHPRFVYHGFQYVEVRGLPAPPTLETITGVVLHTAFEEHGSFACSDPILNRTQQNMLWSFVGNYHGLPTDCPHREKIGWTGDAHLVAETGLFFFDIASAYQKWLDDFVDEQQENGDLPGVIPSSGWGYNFGKNPETRPLGYGPQWEGAVVQMTWDFYRFTGDTAVLNRYYPTLQRYMEHLIRNADGYTLNFGIDDHKPVVTKTEGDILASGYLVGFTRIMGEIAAILGKKADASKYASYSDKAIKGFNKKYFDTKTGSYGNGGQTSQALALYFDIAPENKRELVLQRLLEQIEQHNYHFDAGVVGLKYLFNVLRETGHSELLYRMVTQKDFPGFAYWLKEGANTLWQDWDGSMSHNHVMFATVNEWFFEALAGIQLDEQQPGFRHFHIKPEVLPQIDWATAEHESPYGRLASSWNKPEDGKLVLRATVPPGTTATIHLPAGQNSQVTHNGQAVSIPEYSGERAVFKVSAGEHTWEVSGN